jgi:acyl-[acyl-carrier-protein]-phospholipid O-acyltransferase/long-chain-fatty-acid--[acyl-carrier-protein] ligase
VADPLPVAGCCSLFGQLARNGPAPGLFAALEPGVLWLSLGLLVLTGIVAMGVWWPDRLARLVLWLPRHLLFRLRVHGLENVPAQGPVLLVCNHVSFLDGLLVFLAQKRPLHFIVWAPYTRWWGLRLLMRWVRAIPIDAHAGPRALIQSRRTASEYLARGDVVCIFVEGGVTPTGQLLPFRRGLDQILKRSPVPVVPVCLDHHWGSIFSCRSAGLFFRRWLRNIPYPVEIGFGRPLPPTVEAIEVRQAIQLLSADLALARADERRPVHRQFVRYAARHPFRPCFIDAINKGKVYNYGKALAGARIMTNLLRPILGEEPMVGIWLPSSVASAFANIAVTFLGKIPVNLNYTLTASTIASIIKQCAIRHVLTSRLFVSRMPLEAPPGVEVVYLEDFRSQVSTWQRLRAFLAVLLLPGFVLERWVYRLGHHGPDDLNTIIFSSGSTGEPKGVMLTHRNLSANVESIVQAIDPRAADCILGILPLFHSFGFTVTLWVPLQVGASVVYHADPRQAKETGDLCRTYHCTILLTTPTFLRFNLKRCEPGDFSTLRLLICGAEKLPTSLAQEFKDKFGVLPMEGYGCTELAPVVSSNVPDWQEGSVHQVGNKPGTIGQPVPGVAVRFVHPETFQPLPPGKEGLLLAYGANVMKGYLGKPELTQDASRDGWYVTGDMASLDDDGFLTITGRLSRFSKIGGEMVPHQKIEDELQAILGTTDLVCAVTGVPDPRRGERLVVLHTPFSGVDRCHLCAQLATRGLPNLWVPSERDFYEVAELPVLGTGKLDLKRVKELALRITNGQT